MSHETSTPSGVSFPHYHTKDLQLQNLAVELVALYKESQQLVDLSLHTGNQLRKLALQLQAQLSQELH